LQFLVNYLNFGLLKKIVLITLLCSSFLGSYAQNFIKGSVIDSAGSPVPYCALAILNAKDSSLVKGNVCDDKGEFIYEKVVAGNYIIKFSNVGFKTGWSVPISIDSVSQITLSPQLLRSEGVMLKEISVAAFKPTIEFKSGIVVMNVENNIISGGNTVFEILKRVPGISIDARNNITVNGRGGVRFLIDGRLQQIPTDQMINILMGMPAESVSYIELIKNPPAKYDAAGTGGLINIVMKKARVKGFSGSLSQSGSHGDQWRGGTFLSLNYKSNKLTAFTTINVSYLHFETNNYFLRKITDTSGAFQILSQGRQDPLRKIIYATGGIEYELTKKTIIGLNVTENFGTINNQENASLAVLGTSPYNYNYINFNIGTQQFLSNPTFNVNATHKFDTLTRLQFLTDYTNLNEESSRFTTNNYFNLSHSEVGSVNRFGTNVHNDFNIYTQKLDLTRDFKKSFSLETGFKSSFVTNRSNSVVQLTDPVNGNLYVDSVYSTGYSYHERILAGYATLSKSFKKLDLRAGIRSEHTLIDADNKPKSYVLHRNYINFFPSGSIDYKINDKNSLQSNYSYRIGRPGYDQMSPVRTFNDQFSNGSGNPYLRPQYSHVINLDYSYNNFITISASYQRTKDNIYYYAYGDPKTKITVDSVFNFSRIDNGSMSIFIQKQIKWLNFNVYGAGVFSNNSTLVNGLTVYKQNFYYYSNANVEFLLPKNFKIQLQGFYNSRTTDGIQTYYPIGVANFTIFKSFFNKKLDISFSIFDVFYTDRRPWINQVGGQYSYYTERNDTRRLRGFIVWKFGKMRINHNSKRSNEEESGRLKKVG